MANYQLLKADIDEKVYENAKQKITGENLNSVLKAMVATLGAEYQFAGVATPVTEPGTPDAKVFYIANGKGTYTNFGSLEVTEDEVVVLYWDSSWHKEATGIASQAKLSELEDRVKEDVNAETKFADGNGNIALSIGSNGVNAKQYNICDSDGNVVATINAEFLNDILKRSDIVDNVESDDADKALAAKQGKLLAGMMPDIKVVDDGGDDFIFADQNGYVIARIGKEKFEHSKKKLNLNVPSCVFGIESGTFRGREYFTSIYPESIAISNDLNIKINGNKKYLMQRLKSDATSYDNTYTERQKCVVSADGYADKEIQFDYIRANRLASKNKVMNVLCIGDSITAQGWYSLYLTHLFQMDNIDVAEIKANVLGSIKFKESGYVAPTYIGNQLQDSSYNEGRSGWATYGYLYWPMWVKYNGASYESSSARLNGEGMYYALGLATETPYDSSTASHSFVSFVDNETTKEKVMTTPFGRFKPDCCELLWKALFNYTGKIEGVDSFWKYATGSEKQTGSVIPTYVASTCDAKIIGWLDLIAQNPANHFYDIDRARAYTGSHNWTYDSAFSISKWVERYRTLDDNGNPLTSGYGTKVTKAINHNVCNPTHVVLALGTNDGEDNVIYNITTLISEIESQLPSCKIGYFLPRRPGVINESDWAEYGYQRKLNDCVNVKEAAMRALYGTYNASSKVNYIPAYFTASPLSSGYFDRQAFDLDDVIKGLPDMTPKIVSGANDVHPSEHWHRSVAYQIQAWVYLTNC